MLARHPLTQTMHNVKANSNKSGNSLVLSTRTARVFSGLNAKGNICVVHQCSNDPAASNVASSNDLSHNVPLPFTSEFTQCASWSFDGEIVVKCWTASGDMIACCGHGLMATAASWIAYSTEHSARLPLLLNMNESQIVAGGDGQQLELTFNKMDTERCDLPDWLEQFFPVPPRNSAVAAGDSGYLILEWIDNFDLRSLPVPTEQLALVTQRAIIATCAVSNSDRDQSAAIHFRYFAPQYGTPEDSATGSAMRVLAQYWQQQYWRQQQSVNTLRAYQCSKQGGIIQSRIEGEHVVISGSVQWI
jgi:predicted PhzF superfamily epimerase YddE/YHI9